MYTTKGPPRGATLQNAEIELAAARLLVPIMVRFERALGRYANIRRLLLAKLGEFDAEFIEMEASDLFIEVFGQDIHVILILVRAGPKLDLRQHLVREARAHDKARVAGRVAKVHQAAF